MAFKIGLNPDKSNEWPYDYVVLRHPPATPAVFDFYVKGAMEDFSALPTWKRSAPHSIRKITPRNKTCNNCHGRQELFLSPADMAAWERPANAGVIVREEDVPGPITEETNPNFGKELASRFNPETDTLIILCRSGNRSCTACNEAVKDRDRPEYFMNYPESQPSPGRGLPSAMTLNHRR